MADNGFRYADRPGCWFRRGVGSEMTKITPRPEGVGGDLGSMSIEELAASRQRLSAEELAASRQRLSAEELAASGYARDGA